jgi:hypothetical protein
MTKKLYLAADNRATLRKAMTVVAPSIAIGSSLVFDPVAPASHPQRRRAFDESFRAFRFSADANGLRRSRQVELGQRFLAPRSSR